MDKNSLIGWTLIAVLMVLLLNTMNRNQQQRLKDHPLKEQVKETNQKNPATTTNATADKLTGLKNDSAAITLLSDSVIQQNNLGIYGIFSSYSVGTEEEFVVENKDMKITFSNKGGVPKSVILKNYVTNDKHPLEIYSANGGTLNLRLFTSNTKANNGTIYTDSLFFTPTILKTDSGTVVSYSLNAPDGSQYEHRFRIPAEGFMINFDLNLNKLQNYIATDYLKLYWAQTMPSQEGNVTAEKMYSSVYYADKDLKVEKIGYRKASKKDLNADTKWVSFKQKFFNSTLIAKDAFENNGGAYVNVILPEATDSFVKKVEAELVINYNKSDHFEYPMQMYFGPNKYKDLKALDINLQKVVQIGVSIFGWVNLYMIMPMFNFLSRFIGNYGIIILILTLFIKTIVFPFTYKSNLSMIKMRVLQPELAELKKKFGKDQAKLGPAQMDLYRKAGVNPLGGCLPMLFQMPILIAMYHFFPSSIELRQESFLWAHDLSTYDSIISWKQNIPVLSSMLGNHISLFTVLMAISSFFYTILNSQNTPNDPSNPMAAQMKTFQYIMPFMMIFIFNKFSAALSYYYLLFNVISIAQHYIMKKFMIDEAKIHAEIQANKEKVKTKSKWQIKMEEMMKAQQENQKKRK